ncbi:MAG TPA: hypothetical protein VL634_13765 [Mycobacterium sp.]|nr:hypothetical protein [Mycobacterium sp.]
MPAEDSLQSRILKSFDRYREPAAGPSTKAFGKRLVGELLGESGYVAAALDPAFEVVMHIGGTTVSLPGSAIVEGAPGQAAAGVLMWTEFGDFVVDADTIAASGTMMSLQLTERTLTTTSVGLFVRFRGDVMTSEVVFMGAAQTTDMSAQEMPSVDALRAALASA